jgi:polar amino acid transport system substrate-binding protein
MQAVYRDLAPQGTLRAAVNFANAAIVQRKAADGAPYGLAAELADELARRLSVPVSLLGFDGVAPILEAGLAGGWDLAFLSVDPARSRNLDFTAPYVVLESTYAVHQDSPYRSVLELDREGVRIAVGKGGFYDVRLTRTLKHAELVRAPTYRDAVELFLHDRLDALAGLKVPLIAFAQANGGLRVIEGRFWTVEQAMALPKGRAAGLRYLNTFVDQMNGSGRIAAALRCSFDGIADATRTA